MWELIANIASIGTVVNLIIQIKNVLSNPERVKKLITILLIVSLCLLPVFNYLGEDIEPSISIKFFVAIAIGASISIFRLNSYLSGYSSFAIETKVRVVGSEDKEFKYAVNAKVGDIVEFQLQYKNTSKNSHKQVVVRDVLPKSLQYIDDTTKLYNADYTNGAVAKQNTIVTEEGVNIGNYAAGANAFVRFRAEVVEDTMACGANALVNWGQAQAGVEGSKTILQAKATVYVTKVCENKPEPTDSTPDPEPEPTPELPNNGPEAITGGIIEK